MLSRYFDRKGKENQTAQNRQEDRQEWKGSLFCRQFVDFLFRYIGETLTATHGPNANNA